MVTDYAALAGIVRNGLGLDERASPFSYAYRMYLEIVPCSGVPDGAELVERVIHWDPDVSRQAQRKAVAREACRWALRASGRDDSDASALAFRDALFTFESDAASRLKPPANVRYLPATCQPQRGQRKAAASLSAPRHRRSLPSERRR